MTHPNADDIPNSWEALDSDHLQSTTVGSTIQFSHPNGDAAGSRVSAHRAMNRSNLAVDIRARTFSVGRRCIAMTTAIRKLNKTNVWFVGGGAVVKTNLAYAEKNKQDI